ncbi:unnamed protein product [Lactuca virosa]|uniref:C2 NT-type domain-containing protein n=1 Tax=Lactuca virosa TaxID=75947 RepID=A0AAU9M7E3_9ASTR|nr:unnamed protein product [Lactuca virosa]
MVSGMKAKNRKSPSVQLDYWEHGDKNSGTTKAVTPLLVPGASVGDGKIEFNESFKLHLTLMRDMSIKAGDSDTFLKNCVELNMYEPRRDKIGQLLATAVVDFAEYGVVKDGLIVSVPMNCKRTFSNTSQPMLFLKIQAFEKNNRVRSSSGDSLVREGSTEMNEETESVSITDDDVSSSNGSSNPHKEKEPEDKCGSMDRVVSNQEMLVQDKSKTIAAESVTQKDEELNTNMRSGVEVSKVDDQTSSNLDESQNMGDLESNILSCDRLKKVKSGGSLLDSGTWKSSSRKDGFHGGNERKDINRLQQLQRRVQNLESELKEAAAIEVGLYSIVAEHASSMNKVHAPARRLSRLYLHAYKQISQRATSAKSIVSGLILVAKACGNDVPRLTFWLSNCVVLRAIIYDAFEQDHMSKKKKESCRNEWETPCKFTCSIEKVESWIFSRIIESVWWQTLTPYMQSTAARAIVRIVDSECSKKTSREQEQANFSMELWKTAFMDACERICPVRAAGHDCGCLSVLSRLVMEECMGRLDVAMFNAILRESADEAPTDPVSDPISDARVLPVSSGKPSFGAGAQLKNAIGNWSRWLTDLFGIDDDDDDSFKSFHLLNALSDLMMLPKDMLLDSRIRKEVCPSFGAALIKGILDSFVPDEFCPDAIPEAVLEALDSEDLVEGGEDCVSSVPCAAGSVVYHPPSASSIIKCIFGGTKKHLSRSGSSLLRKSNTSDDELDDLSSPFTAINIIDAAPAPTTPSPRWRSNDGSIRYQLLKEVWMNSD